MNEALDLPCDLFLLCYKNRTVELLSQTEEGREYLKDCKRLRQTEMDMDGLRRLQAIMRG